MSEKRFSETERNFYYTSLVFDNHTKEELGTSKVVVLLNEQQANIDKLEQENADLLGDNIRSLDEFDKCTNKLKKKILEQQATIESLKKDLKIWYVELMLNTPREHSLWVKDVVEKYSFLKELDDE